jgi:RimJ/RimL family protein N-acetyltransferase
MIPLEFDRPLQTPRLRIRLMTDADIDAITAHESRADVCEYLLYEPRTRDEVAEKIADWAIRTRLRRDGDFLQLAVALNDGRVIGELYFSLVSVEYETAEIGWVLSPDHQGHGYAAEAATALLDLGFGRMRLHRIKAELAPENTASVSLCLRLGMREEAHFVEDMFVKGHWEDTGVYALLRREWDGRASPAG